jgi:DNA-binding NarL/FixJ family response regulator
MKRKRLIAADDHQIILDALKRLLTPEFELVGTAYDGRTLVSEVVRLRPEVIVVDISMPLLNGIEAVRQIKKFDPQVKVVFLTMHDDINYIIRAFEVGAAGYVLKHCSFSELLVAIHAVIQGRTYVTPLIAGEWIQSYQAGVHRRSDPSPQLTTRQREILQLLAEGRSVKEIAQILQISCRTVEFHKYSLISRLKVKTFPALLQYAIRHGYTEAAPQAPQDGDIPVGRE